MYNSFKACGLENIHKTDLNKWHQFTCTCISTKIPKKRTESSGWYVFPTKLTCWNRFVNVYFVLSAGFLAALSFLSAALFLFCRLLASLFRGIIGNVCNINTLDKIHWKTSIAHSSNSFPISFRFEIYGADFDKSFWQLNLFITHLEGLLRNAGF